MNFDFTDEQEQLRDAVRKWVDKSYTFDRRRSIEATGGFSKEAFDELNALGLGGNGLPDFNSSAIQTKMINRKVEIKITEKEAGSYDIMMVRAL